MSGRPKSVLGWRPAYAEAAGEIAVKQGKTGAELQIAVHHALREALAARPRTHVTILTTEYGKPFTVDGFGNWMADAIAAAGLPDRCVTHGLRKASARRIAEAGGSSKEIMSVTGHKTLAEVERYTKAAEQRGLAKAAVHRLEEHFGTGVPKPKRNRTPKPKK